MRKEVFELRGKTLGIIGYGNIGSQVSVMAEALGLNVIYYDVITKLPHGNAKQIRDLNELLSTIRHRYSARSVGCDNAPNDRRKYFSRHQARRDLSQLFARRCR